MFQLNADNELSFITPRGRSTLLWVLNTPSFRLKDPTVFIPAAQAMHVKVFPVSLMSDDFYQLDCEYFQGSPEQPPLAEFCRLLKRHLAPGSTLVLREMAVSEDEPVLVRTWYLREHQDIPIQVELSLLGTCLKQLFPNLAMWRLPADFVEPQNTLIGEPT